MDLNPMKYLSTMQFDLKTNCTKKAYIANFILGEVNDNVKRF